MQKGTKVDLLDHGMIRYIDSMGDDLAISRNARVSYDSPARAEDEKLISYLYNNGHNTPFEAVTVTVEVKAPIFVLRQWMRHRTQSFNELSARYRKLPTEFYTPEEHLMGRQSTDNKQMRDVITKEAYALLPKEERNNTTRSIAIMREVNTQAFEAYEKLIREDVPRELARSILPVATYSHMFATANLNNWFKFVGERLHQHAQYEIRVYAEALLDILETVAPLATKAFKRRFEQSE